MVFSYRTAFLSLSLTVGSALGTLYSSPSQLPTSKKYDFIIVGSGAGGGVLAGRLSELPNANVLLIEAGPDVAGVVSTEVPFLGPNLIGTEFDWNFTTAAQSGLNGRAITYSRGFGLGGSTSVNFMVYTRGSEDDYNRWASVTQDDAWGWSSLQQYFTKMEKLVPSADNLSQSGKLNPSIHGTSGPLDVSLPGFSLVTDDLVIGATADFPSQFPFNEDMNSGNTIGIGWVQYTIGGGQRASSYTAYIAPAMSRPNLDVLVNTQVTKVIQTGTSSGSPIFRGVQFGAPGGPLFALNATHEVLLCAGAVKTPQILLLSGIGPQAQLSKLGIKTIVNNAHVGANLQDHPLLSSPFTVNSTATFDAISQNPSLVGDLLNQWETSKTGEFTLGPANQLGWLRLPSSSSIFKSVPDPSAGPTSGHYELIFTDGFVSFSVPSPATGNYFSLFTNVVSPSSRGSITLKSTNPFDAPIIDPGLLNSEFDIFAMREAIKAGKQFMTAKAFDGFIIEPFGDFAAATTDAEIETYAREFSTTVWHPTSSAAMTSWSSSAGVLNPDLTVKGTVGLRVVDASAFPFVPAAHPQTAVYVIAERASDLIKTSFYASSH
ncbi:aryl-alcohol oxidase-like protein [Artomyces pyxidatus]|uniref:Aryl-alcohol oxidase-like protein n=1 Tax=Artomyces pyxidatus TaxID=48021 RepID=A0ACB8TF61_9AGAM|nr:aryl-alcohol oxidase-like protein [Artomyces pyxidatus]